MLTQNNNPLYFDLGLKNEKNKNLFPTFTNFNILFDLNLLLVIVHYIYIHIYVCVCVCVCAENNVNMHINKALTAIDRITQSYGNLIFLIK